MTYEEALKRFKASYERTKDYYDPYWEGSEYREHKEWVEQLEATIKALEKQVPKKPNFTGGWFAQCVSCGSFYDLQSRKYQYSQNCGQAIDWIGLE